MLEIKRVVKGVFRRLRAHYYSIVLKCMGQGCQICGGVVFAGEDNISLGNRVIINEYAVIQSCNGASVEIGDDVHMSYAAKVITGGLDLEILVGKTSHISKPIVIERGVWLGANSIILPGVTVGENSVVAAGAVVTKSVKSDVTVAGVPARIIKTDNP